MSLNTLEPVTHPFPRPSLHPPAGGAGWQCGGGSGQYGGGQASPVPEAFMLGEDPELGDYLRR